MKRYYLLVAAILLMLLFSGQTHVQSLACPAPRLKSGVRAVLAFRPSIELRSAPGGGVLITTLSIRRQTGWYDVLDGPVCAPDGVLWWHVKIDQGITGFAPEGGGSTYWVYPEPKDNVSITARGAVQQFEHGYMIWREDAGDITVLVGNDGGSFSGFTNSAYARLPDNPTKITPPSGLVRPINGFGKVWGNYPQVRADLGWAVGPEQPYTMTLSLDVPSVARVISLPDKRSVRLHYHLVLYWSIQN